jgi:hypothetical protein
MVLKINKSKKKKKWNKYKNKNKKKKKLNQWKVIKCEMYIKKEHISN